MSDFKEIKLKIYQAFENNLITESEKDYLFSVMEASKLTKEYNKKQSEYQSRIKKIDTEIENQKHKIEKLKRSLYDHRVFSNGSINRQTIIRSIELADDKIDELEKEKKRLKYLSKSQGLNRDILYKDDTNSLKTGREAAKKISQINQTKEFKEWKNKFKLAKTNGDLITMKKLLDNPPKDVNVWDDIDVRKASKEKGLMLKDKQTQFKDQGGKERNYSAKRDYIFRTSSKEPNNVLHYQSELKEIDKNIKFDKKHGKFIPKGGTDRGNLNTVSKEREKELRDKFKKDCDTFTRMYDTRKNRRTDKENYSGSTKAEAIRNFENLWWENVENNKPPKNINKIISDILDKTF